MRLRDYKTTGLLTVIIAAWGQAAYSQTPSTNDVRVVVVVQLQLSSNQFAGCLMQYRMATNDLRTNDVVPSFGQWLQTAVKQREGAIYDHYVEAAKQAEDGRGSWGRWTVLV